MSAPEEDLYDVVVAGSGAGGAAVARRLCEAGARVLLAEAGTRAEPKEDAFEAVLRYYAHGGFWAPLGNCLLPIPTGRTLGGTTTINSGTCFDTPASSLEAWERGSAGAFDAASFEGSLAEARRLLPVRRAPAETASESTRLFLRGLDALGWKGGGLLERAERGCKGSGRCCFVCPEGAKATSETAFLESAPPTLEIASGASLRWAEPAPKAGGLARAGLRGPDGGRAVSCRALVLACGALATPYFVRRARLGPAWRTAGDGLSVHPATKIFALFDRPVGEAGVPQGAGWEDPEVPGSRYEGVYTPPELAAITLPLEGRALRGWLDRFDRVATFGVMVRDSALGSVRYPLGASFPLVRYDLAASDAARLGAAALRLARVFLAAGAERVLLPFLTPPNEFRSESELSGRAPPEPWELQLMAFHPLGTCAMGRVVDWRLRVAEGIYVCDGSVVPGPLGVNPQLTIYALALRLADHLLGSRLRETVA